MKLCTKGGLSPVNVADFLRHICRFPWIHIFLFCLILLNSSRVIHIVKNYKLLWNNLFYLFIFLKV